MEWIMVRHRAYNARVTLAGEQALARLVGRLFCCRASFARSFYVANGTRELVCFLADGLEPGPLNALCAPWPAAEALPAAGESLRREGTALLWGGGRIDLAGAGLWLPPPLPEAMVAPFHRLDHRLELLARIERNNPQGELAPLFALFLGDRPLPEDASPLLRAGAEATESLARWLQAVPGGESRENPPDEPPVSGLLGLGPGLTPSGDDVLGGVMIILCRLAGVFPSAASTVDHLHAAIRALPGHTNAISRAHLDLAAQGLGAETLLHFVDSLVMTHPDRPDDMLLAKLGRIGHSSGWDMALGAVIAFLSLPRNPSTLHCPHGNEHPRRPAVPPSHCPALPGTEQPDCRR